MTTAVHRVLGGGPLAVAVSAAVAANGEQPTTLVSSLDALPRWHELLAAEKSRNSPVLFVGYWRALCYIGPHWTPGNQGCPRCLATRVANSNYGPPQTGDQPAETATIAGHDYRGQGLPPAFIRLAANLAAEYAVPSAAGAPPAVWLLDCATGTVSKQPLLPDSTCPVCGPPPSSPLPRWNDAGSPFRKLAGDVLRAKEIDHGLIEEFLRPGIGLFKEVTEDLDCPVAASSVEQPARWGPREPAIGRASTYRASRSIAVLEGLERYAGLHCGGRPPVLRARYADVHDRAIAPDALGLHPPESHAIPGFRFTPFSAETPVDWLPGYSFRRGGSVLVPERAVNWGPRHDGGPSFCYETSNGCALGSSIEEATLHGLRELAERDSFLLTWYRRLSLPEIALDEIERPRIRRMLGKASLLTGCRFRAFESTMEYRMPSFWLVAEGRRADGPAVVAGACAHPDPVQALASGLDELVGAVQYVQFHYQRRRPDALAMLADPGLVRRMEDHAAVNALPEARDRFSFLLDSGRTPVSPDTVTATVSVKSTELRTDLETAIDGVLGQGFDVIVVDQTMPELRRYGYCCAKVLVPGLVPMTFGHRHRRTRGLPRLTSAVPLPWPSDTDGVETADRLPHPFP